MCWLQIKTTVFYTFYADLNGLLAWQTYRLSLNS
jgi:hypothetical protein